MEGPTMIAITTEKPERPTALHAIKQAVLTGSYHWPAGESYKPLTRQLAAYLHTVIGDNDIEDIVDAYDNYVGLPDWNHEEILDYMDETRWHPALEDAAWDKALRILRETTNEILLALHYDLLDDADTAALYKTTTTELRSAA